MTRQAYPEYKPSGVEWLGDVPEHWEVRRLKYSADLVNQKVDGSESDLPYTGLEHIESWTGRRIAPNGGASSEGQANLYRSGDVLFGKLRPYLAKVHAADADGICTGELLVLRPRAVHQRFFLDYLLSPNVISIVDSSTYGAKMPRANWDFIGKLPVLIPPMNEQQSIAAFLDRETATIDALVARKERLIELLQEKRTALISHAVTKGLNPDAKMKDSGVEWLGRIPEHWDVTKLILVTERIGDGLHGTPDYLEGSGLYFVNGNNLVAEEIRFFDSTREVTPAAYQTHKLPLGEKTVLLSINGTIGNLGLCRGEKIMLGKSAAFINCKPKLDRLFLTKYLQSNSVRRYFDLELTGTTISNLSLASIRQTPVLLPPLSEQIDIVGAIEQQTLKLDALIGEVTLAIECLREYRTALISAAVTGKIDVRKEVSCP